MHYNINYSKLPPAEAHAKALADIKDYLGACKFKAICKIVHGDQTINRESFIMSLSMFMGIEGFPAQAFADELGLVVKSTETAPNS